MIRHLVVVAALFGAPLAGAEEPAAPDPLPLPLFDLPRSLDTGYRLTWDQSMSLHHALIVGGNHAIPFGAWKLLGGSPFWAYFAEMGATSLFDLGTTVLPLGQRWEH